jgi:hypothetical protein
MAVGVQVAARRCGVTPEPEASDDVVLAEAAIHRWSVRTLYLAGTVTVVSTVLLAPGQAAQPEYTMPQVFPEEMVVFRTVGKIRPPTCAWMDQMDSPCRSWLVDGTPFPQAAPYVIAKDGGPRRAPFIRSSDRKAVVYLARTNRQLIYQNADGVNTLTDTLPDDSVPTPTFGLQSRYVALSTVSPAITQIIDTATWSRLTIPGAEKVHDLNRNGMVVETAERILVLDHLGKRRMSLPRRNAPAMDTYHLRRDGKRLVVIRTYDERVETYAPSTGKRLAGVRLVLPDAAVLDVGLGWSKEGSFLVRDSDDRVYHLDLDTGGLKRRKK